MARTSHVTNTGIKDKIFIKITLILVNSFVKLHVSVTLQKLDL